MALGGGEVDGGVCGGAVRGTVERGIDIGVIVGIGNGRETGGAVGVEEGVVERERERGECWGYVCTYVVYVFCVSHLHLHFSLPFPARMLSQSGVNTQQYIGYQARMTKL